MPSGVLVRNRGGEPSHVAENDIVTDIFMCDRTGIYEPKIDSFIASFGGALRHVEIYTVSSTYAAHIFRGKFPDLRVRINELRSVPGAGWLDVRVYGSFHDGKVLKNTHLSWLLRERDLGFRAQAIRLTYTSPMTSVIVHPTMERVEPLLAVPGAQHAAPLNFQSEFVERLTLSNYYCGALVGDPDLRTNNSAITYLRGIAKRDISFPRLRKLSVKTDTPTYPIISFIEAYRETMFPALTTLVLRRVTEGYLITSSFLERIHLKGRALGVSISCPTCKILDIADPNSLSLLKGTEPAIMIIRECRTMSWIVFERLVRSAVSLTVVVMEPLVGLPGQPSRPMQLPALKKFVIWHSHIDDSLPIRFFAPRLEEVWIGGTHVSPDYITRDEDGAFLLC
jgi:hypothetical protein